jgi:DNA polymerase-3 subunit alpha
MYTPLRVFSPFSIGYGAVKTDQLANFCVKNGIPAAGIADLNTLSGVMTNAKELRAKGIQPLAGMTLTLANKGVKGDVVFYATNKDGYQALLRMSNAANTQAPGADRLSILQAKELIAQDARNLVIMTGGIRGLASAVHKAGQDLSDVLYNLSFMGADLFVEIERNGDERDEAEADLIAAASDADLPVVATSRAAYTTPDMMDAHDTFLCISEKTYKSQDDRAKSKPGLHIATPEEMSARFADLPNALLNSIEISRKAAFMIEPVQPHTPAYPVQNGESEEDILRADAAKGIAERIKGKPSVNIDAYQQRLKYELDVITKMGFAGYFLIVSDFISWAKVQDIPVGPGRGSGAGSLVAYALGITDIDPIDFGLLFERFLNPERVSLPDFDIDFCQERREEVIEYVRAKYGEDKVAHISAFGTLQARAVVRAVGRVQQLPYPQVDYYAKMIPQNPNNPVSLAGAMEEGDLAEELAKADSAMQRVFNTALKLEGLLSHVSTHAAGVIISDQPIADVVPVHIDQHGKLATSFEMKAAESAGLVKFDFLGLKNLDAIHGARSFIRKTNGEEIDFEDIAFNDPKTYANLAGGDGFAVFQLESSGMCRAMRELRIDNIDELIALISLYRPGPMEQIPTFAAVKSGEESVHYLHPEMEQVLSPTNGVMIYQEQVMEIARRLAGYSLGEADLLRRAMGKKIQSEMDAQRERFSEGAAAGWVEVELDDGTSKRMHALSKVSASDGTGRMVTLQDAMEQGLDISLAA